MGTKPKVPSIQEQDDPGDDSSEALFDSKANNTFLRTVISLWHTLVFIKKYYPLILLHDKGFLSYWLCSLESLKLMVCLLSLFWEILTPKGSNTSIRRHWFFSHATNEESCNCGPHSPFTKELLNASSIGNFVPHDWRLLVRALLKPGEYLQWTVWFQDVARDHANSNARAGTPQNQITFEMLTGTGQSLVENYLDCNNCSHLVLAVCFLYL